jgi:hypothetical protein
MFTGVCVGRLHVPLFMHHSQHSYHCPYFVFYVHVFITLPLHRSTAIRVTSQYAHPILPAFEGPDGHLHTTKLVDHEALNQYTSYASVVLTFRLVALTAEYLYSKQTLRVLACLDPLSPTYRYSRCESASSPTP